MNTYLNNKSWIQNQKIYPDSKNFYTDYTTLYPYNFSIADDFLNDFKTRKSKYKDW